MLPERDASPLPFSSMRLQRVGQRLLLPLFLLLVLVVSVMIFRRFQASPPDQLSVGSTQVSSAHPENGAVSCLGRIEPQDGVLRVTAAYLEGRPQRVRELMVKQDDRVRAGQQLAILDGKEQLQTLLHLAEARVDLARTRLTQVKAGA